MKFVQSLKNLAFKDFVAFAAWAGGAGIAVCAFALSFDVLRVDAVRQGVAPNLAPLIPIIIDGTIMIFTLVYVYGKQTKNNRVARFAGWSIVGTTLFTLIMNASHAFVLDGVASQVHKVAIFVAPPVFLAISIHAISMMMEKEVAAKSKNAKQVKQRVASPTSGNVPNSTTLKETHSKEITVFGTGELTQREALVLQVFASGVTTQRGIAEKIQEQFPVTHTTVKRDLDKLFKNGALQKDQKDRYILAG